MVGPIQALRTGAARIGSGDLSQRIAIKTGDELEVLADQFNDMAGRLQESYAGLEQKVDLRTRTERVAGATDRHRRRAQGHQPLHVRPQFGASNAC
jgi:nitrate/nitrite-specific signal transduction histidine kinase